MPTTIQIDDVSFSLREEHDFRWLKEFGRVFRVFDQQDSGNISFGMDAGNDRLFVKYAGARTLHYDGDRNDAVTALQRCIPTYEDLRHPHLVNLVSHGPVGDGYAVVFEWFDGECLHPHWEYPPPAKYSHPSSPFFKFIQLPLERKLRTLDVIYQFHVHVESLGYVAVDFYDGSILYHFATNDLRICDIDLYSRKPFVNEMGRMWGSSRFMSPEEHELGAVIDERTNVFNMGATAFVLLGGEKDRSPALWDASDELYEVALCAVNPDRSLRYKDVAEFYAAWRQATAASQR